VPGPVGAVVVLRRLVLHTYASVIVAQLAGVAAAVAVGKWLWVSFRDGCRDLY
jgi:hypothetical protein